jgi:hypothetical protein
MLLYYTNSSQLPVGKTDDPFAAMVHQEAFQRRYTEARYSPLYGRAHFQCTRLQRTCSPHSYPLPHSLHHNPRQRFRFAKTRLSRWRA